MASRFAGSTTNISLIERLRQNPTNQVAWAEFTLQCEPLLLQWCARWKLQEMDAEDVTQAVLLKLAEKMRTFVYDPTRSFRGYLRTLAHYARCDLIETRKRAVAGSGDSDVLAALESVEARDELVAQLSAEYDQELRAEAMTLVQQRVEPHTWQAFLLTALEGLSAALVATRLNLKVATVYKARSKVQQMLRQEIRRLEAAES